MVRPVLKQVLSITINLRHLQHLLVDNVFNDAKRVEGYQGDEGITIIMVGGTGYIQRLVGSTKDVYGGKAHGNVSTQSYLW